MSKQLRGLVMTGAALFVLMLLINDNQHWHSDWSQFLPDALVALLTGATVGLVVLAFQRGIESRAEERAQALQWSAVRELLARATAGTQDITFLFASAKVVGFDHERIVEVTDGVPVQAWRDTLADDTLQYLVIYLDSLSAAQKSANLLDAALNSAVISAPDDLIEPFRQNQVRQSVLDWIDVARHRERRSVDPLDQAAVASILGDASVNREGREWRVNIMALAYAYLSLAESLNPDTFQLDGPKGVC